MIPAKSQNLIHIGYPKTGTTWFQKRFFPYAENFEFISRDKLCDLIGDNKNRQEASEASNIIQEKYPDKRIIISDESLLGKPEKYIVNAKYYKEVFPNSLILIFIRNQVEKFASNYSEYIKGGGTLKVDDFLFRRENELTGGEKHCYHKAIEAYGSVFGKDNVAIYLYEDFAANSQDFLSRFCTKYDIRLNLSNIRINSVNRKLSKNQLALKRLCNMFTKKQVGWINPAYKKKCVFHIPYWFQVSYVLFNILSSFNNRKRTRSEFVLQEKNIEFIREYFRESNQLLVEKYKLDLVKNYNYPL